MKEMGTKSFACQLLSYVVVGYTHSSNATSSSKSPTALTSWLPIRRWGFHVRACLTSFWALIVKSKPHLSTLNGISGSYPQVSRLSSSTTAHASLNETIFCTTLTALDTSEENLEVATIGCTTSKAWHRVSMNFPSIYTYLKELRWLTMNSSSPQTVTILPLTGYLRFWGRVNVTSPAPWIQGRSSKQD